MLTRHWFTNCLSSPFIRLSERLWKIGSKASPQLSGLPQWWQKVFTLPTNYRSQIFTFARNCGYIKEKLLNKLWFVCHRSDTFGLVLFYATRLASPPRQSVKLANENLDHHIANAGVFHYFNKIYFKLRSEEISWPFSKEVRCENSNSSPNGCVTTKKHYEQDATKHIKKTVPFWTRSVTLLGASSAISCHTPVDQNGLKNVNR